MEAAHVTLPTCAMVRLINAQIAEDNRLYGDDSGRHTWNKALDLLPRTQFTCFSCDCHHFNHACADGYHPSDSCPAIKSGCQCDCHQRKEPPMTLAQAQLWKAICVVERDEALRRYDEHPTNTLRHAARKAAEQRLAIAREAYGEAIHRYNCERPAR